MQDILHKLAFSQLSTCVSIILMFTYTILLNRDFACTCQSQELDCYSYMALPFFIIFSLTLWTNRKFLKVCSYTCDFCCSQGCSKKCCCFLIFASPKVVEAVSVGLLWVAFVLIDGDWYVCCQNNGSDAQVVLACKAAAKITEKEQAMISDLKNKSRNIGGGLLLGIIFMGFLLTFFLRIRCCTKERCCDRQFVYDKCILEEEGKVLKEVLRKSAHDQLINQIRIKIRGDHWKDCFDVAEELIKKSTPPDAPEQKEEREMERRAAEHQEQDDQQEEEHTI
ncbi:uncharacterized protein LOC132990285 [Labrus mixtus]|uniref:uncharacterized protein LOC132990285 n=1 Tax=Labrus mixtus TaxID=508554 RepID=UPI0029BFFDE1|nr:uncharacterized protein LOC132990285 [Labrus mixtus]